MLKLRSIFLCLILVFGCLGSGLLAKGGKAEGKGSQATAGGKSSIHGNGQSTDDRDFGTERATEAGKGKKKGLAKAEHSEHHEQALKHKENSHSHSGK
jgi:hypothetical protein